MQLTITFDSLQDLQTWVSQQLDLAEVTQQTPAEPTPTTKRKPGRPKKGSAPVDAKAIVEAVAKPPEPEPEATADDRPDLDTELRTRIKRLMDEGKAEVFKQVFDDFSVKKYVQIPEKKRLELEAQLIAKEEDLFPEDDPLA